MIPPRQKAKLDAALCLVAQMEGKGILDFGTAFTLLNRDLAKLLVENPTQQTITLEHLFGMMSAALTAKGGDRT